MTGLIRPVLLIATAAAAALLATPGLASARCAGADLVPTAGNLATVNQALRCLVNEERRRAGRRPLRQNAKLGRAASRHSAGIVARDDVGGFAPRGSILTSLAEEAGYLDRDDTYAIGGNVAAATLRRATPREFMADWMRGVSSAANIRRGEFRDIGLAYAIGLPRSVRGRRGATVTAVFGYVRPRQR